MRDFRELAVWQEGKNLVVMVYKATENFPKHELFGLTSQLRRAAVSIPSNIAEGSGRNTKKEAAHFCYISRGSLFELETQLIISEELIYLTSDDLSFLNQQITKCRQLINGTINYFERD